MDQTDLLSGPCSGCGRKYPPAVMGFYSRRSLEPRPALNAASWEQTQESLSDSILLCDNCHKLRQEERKPKRKPKRPKKIDSRLKLPHLESDPNMPVAEIIENAHRAIKHARGVRRLHAKRSKKDSPQRAIDIRIASEHLREAMHPIRRRLGKATFRPRFESKIIRELSKEMQRERHKLIKMVPKGTLR